jgi:hypothetical protein
MYFCERCEKISAKPLFIGSIPIAASNLLNNLETLHCYRKAYSSKNVVSLCIVVSRSTLLVVSSMRDRPVFDEVEQIDS